MPKQRVIVGFGYAVGAHEVLLNEQRRREQLVLRTDEPEPTFVLAYLPYRKVHLITELTYTELLAAAVEAHLAAHHVTRPDPAT